MKKLAALALLSAAALVPMTDAATRPPAVLELDASYDLRFASLPVGRASVSASVDGNAYRAGVAVETTGLVRLFADDEWEAESLGLLDSAGLMPTVYRANTDEREVEVGFTAGAPQSVLAEPEFDAEPWSIEPRAQQGVTDPATALVSLLAPVQAEEACNRHIEAFDGQRRFAFVLGEAQVENDGIRCNGALVYVAGYKPNKIGRQRTFSVEYARRDDELVQIDRVTLPTDMGNVVMRLRD